MHGTRAGTGIQRPTRSNWRPSFISGSYLLGFEGRSSVACPFARSSGDDPDAMELGYRRLYCLSTVRGSPGLPMRREFDVARHFGERAERYDQEAFLGGAGLAAISDRELSIVRNRLGQVEAT